MALYCRTTWLRVLSIIPQDFLFVAPVSGQWIPAYEPMFTSCRCFKKNQPPNNLTKLGHFQTLTSSHTQVVFIPFDVVRDGKLPVIHSIPWDGIQVWLVSPRVLLPRQAIYVHRPSPNAANWKKITMQMWIKQSTSNKALSQKKNSRHFKIMLDLIYRISKSIFQSYPCWYPPGNDHI